MEFRRVLFRSDLVVEGNVGIGTTNPSGPIEVSHDGTAHDLVVDSSGNVGIGTTNPSGPIEVSHDGIAHDLVVDSSGNVGIGTSSPSEKLDVQKDGDVYLKVHATTGSGQIAGFKLQRGNTSDIYTDWTIYDDGGVLKFEASDTTYGTNDYLAITTDGHVGIGTTSQVIDESLTINTNSDSYGFVQTDGTVTIGSWISSGTAGQIGTYSDHRLDFFTNDSSAIMTIGTSGNVGIGTTSPVSKLQVMGDIQVGDDSAWSSSADDVIMNFGDKNYVYLGEKGADDTMELSANTFFFANGTVGIGTASPGEMLDVQGGEIWSTYTTGKPQVALASNSNSAFIRFNEYYSSDHKYSTTGGAAIIKVWTSQSGEEGDITFETAPSGTAGSTATFSERMRIEQGGNVGIGTSSPQAKLDVNGSINVNNNKITNLIMPTTSSDAATKGYVDAATQGIGKSRSQYFTSNGTFTVPDNVSLVWVTAWGGGGGGGGSIHTIYREGGGGGAGGSIIYKYPVTVTPGEVINVIVGTGGTGGTGNYTSGGDGGNTSFGSYLTVIGGGGGKIGVEGVKGGKGGSSDCSIGGAGGTSTNGNGVDASARTGTTDTIHFYYICGSGGGGGSHDNGYSGDGLDLLPYKNGGGGAGSYSGGGGGAGFKGDGGKGGDYSNQTGGSAPPNSGAGGGGGSPSGSTGDGGAGGSGGLIVEWIE